MSRDSQKGSARKVPTAVASQLAFANPDNRASWSRNALLVIGGPHANGMVSGYRTSARAGGEAGQNLSREPVT
jgi:hypothetical protein